MNSNNTMIKKLQNAINGKGYKLLYNTTQFYSEEQSRVITLFIIKSSMLDKETGKIRNIELFKSCSQIQIVLFLRDFWFIINKKELPAQNKEWDMIRKTIPILNEMKEGIK